MLMHTYIGESAVDRSNWSTNIDNHAHKDTAAANAGGRNDGHSHSSMNRVHTNMSTSMAWNANFANNHNNHHNNDNNNNGASGPFVMSGTSLMHDKLQAARSLLSSQRE